MSQKRALIISGGGALGSYACGLLKGLNREYDFVSGISTGALIAPLAALRQWDRLEEAYCNVTLDSVFSVSPFTDKGKIRIAHAIKRLVLGKSSFGEMDNLKTLINQFYTVADHEALNFQRKQVLVQALNLSSQPSVLDAFYSDRCSYSLFKQAMFASCCFAPVSNIAQIGGSWYVDGGFVETITVDKALAAGYRKLDVVVLRPKIVEQHKSYPKNMFLLAGRLWSAMRYDIVYENLMKALSLAAKCPDVDINVYYLPEKFTDNAMYFNADQMRSWYEQGYELGMQDAHRVTV